MELAEHPDDVRVRERLEAWRLFDTITAWRTEIDTYIATRVTNARTEAANTGIKQIKRTGRGYRNAEHYRARILLNSTGNRRRHSTQRTGFSYWTSSTVNGWAAG